MPRLARWALPPALTLLSACPHLPGWGETRPTVLMVRPPLADATPARLLDGDRGPVLADDRGMALYILDKDKPGKSLCYAKCAANWPPFEASAEARPSGDWSVISRADGRRQWAYRQRPVYTSGKDQKPGDTRGDGDLGVWHLVRP